MGIPQEEIYPMQAEGDLHVTGHFFTQPGQKPEVASAGRAFEQLSRNVVQEKKRRGRIASDALK